MSDTDTGQENLGGSVPPDALGEITAAADGLLMPSESDYPFEPFRWPGPGPLTPEALVEFLELPPGTPVEVRELDAFFEPLTSVRDWQDADQRAAAARFALLRDLLHDLLADVMVYRAGSIQIPVVIAGRDPSGATVGLRTTVIET
ncbi:MAG: nuclease [Chloroflexales bacterium]|nr:nuclease [Chloroflexales bacterium]